MLARRVLLPNGVPGEGSEGREAPRARQEPARAVDTAYLGAARLLAAAPLRVPPAKLSPPAAGGLAAALVLAQLRASAAVVLAWLPWAENGEKNMRASRKGSGTVKVAGRAPLKSTRLRYCCERNKKPRPCPCQGFSCGGPASGGGRRAESSVRSSLFSERGALPPS